MLKRYLTLQKLKELKKELQELKTTKRKEIAERLKHTSSFGDLSENFAYQQAKEDQAFLEARIKELEEIINSAEILKNNSSEKVEVGSVVIMKNVIKKQKEKFQIVDPLEANPSENKISFNSPLGKELIGKSVGEKVKIKTPKGILEYEIIEIT